MFKLITGPITEPVSLLEAKQHLRLIGNDDKASDQIIPPGLYSPTWSTDEIPVDTPIVGATIDLSGYQGTITLDAGACAGELTVDIYHRNDPAEEWLKWDSFAEVTAANDNQSYTLEYGGGKRYIKAEASIKTDDCSFGVSVVKQAPASPEDVWINETIQMVREEAEEYQGRSFLTTEWELILDDWSTRMGRFSWLIGKYIEIEKSPIQSIESIKYTDYLGTEHTFDSSKYYLDLDQFWPRICLKYGESWPSDILRESGAIRIAFTAGYTSVDEFKKENKNTHRWMLTAIKQLYDDRSLTVDDINHKALGWGRVRGYF